MTENDVKKMVKDIFYDLIAATVDNCQDKSEDYRIGYFNGLADGSKITIEKVVTFMQKIVEENTPKDESLDDDYRKLIKDLASRMN